MVGDSIVVLPIGSAFEKTDLRCHAQDYLQEFGSLVHRTARHSSTYSLLMCSEQDRRRHGSDEEIVLVSQETRYATVLRFGSGWHQCRAALS